MTPRVHHPHIAPKDDRGLVARLVTLVAETRELRAANRTLLKDLRTSFAEFRTQQRRSLGTPLVERAPAGGDERQRMLQELYHLTAREAEVALLLAEGSSNFAVARELGISPHTARHHTQRVLGKLSVRSRALAGARVRRLIA